MRNWNWKHTNFMRKNYAIINDKSQWAELVIVDVINTFDKQKRSRLQLFTYVLGQFEHNLN